MALSTVKFTKRIAVLRQACRLVHPHSQHCLCVASLLLQTADYSCSQSMPLLTVKFKKTTDGKVRIAVLWPACRPVRPHYWHRLCIASLLLQTADYSCSQSMALSDFQFKLQDQNSDFKTLILLTCGKHADQSHPHYWHWLCVASLLLQTADHSCNQHTSLDSCQWLL